MPVLLTIGAVGVIAILMVIGFRQGWDPSPGPLPPSSMSVPATPSALAALPRWFVALLLAGPACAIVLVVISATTERRWLAVAGYVVLGLSWGVRQAMLVWIYSKTTLQRSAAVLRPVSLVLGFVAAAAFDSGWWVLAGLIVSLTILPLADVVERRLSRDSVPEMRTPPSRTG